MRWSWARFPIEHEINALKCVGDPLGYHVEGNDGPEVNLPGQHILQELVYEQMLEPEGPGVHVLTSGLIHLHLLRPDLHL